MPLLVDDVLVLPAISCVTTRKYQVPSANESLGAKRGAETELIAYKTKMIPQEFDLKSASTLAELAIKAQAATTAAEKVKQEGELRA